MNNFSSATGHTMDFLGISNLNFNYAIRTLDRNECCRKCWRCFKWAELLPNSAIKVMDNGQREEVISDIMTDDIVEVKAGESIPTDGIIVQGQTSIDES